jgi:hypothetical protein
LRAIINFCWRYNEKNTKFLNNRCVLWQNNSIHPSL